MNSPAKHNWVSFCLINKNVFFITIRETWQNVPRTRSSITWDKTFTTVMFPIRAKAMEAADRMKSPTKMAWKRKHSCRRFRPHEEKEGPGFRFSYFSLPPDLVDGSLPPPLIRTVDHVIVHEAGSVDHFWDHSYGSLTREQISEGDGVKGSEMKLRLIPQKNRIPLNVCEILDI